MGAIQQCMTSIQKQFFAGIKINVGILKRRSNFELELIFNSISTLIEPNVFISDVYE